MYVVDPKLFPQILGFKAQETPTRTENMQSSSYSKTALSGRSSEKRDSSPSCLQPTTCNKRMRLTGDDNRDYDALQRQGTTEASAFPGLHSQIGSFSELYNNLEVDDEEEVCYGMVKGLLTLCREH
jgi:hypothetical protein